MTEPKKHNSGDLLYVVIKITERCVLNCDYCYFFKGIDQSYKDHPAAVTDATIDGIAAFLKTGCKELNITHMVICLHGGEPLLLGHSKFDRMCSVFRESLRDIDLYFVLQTNGVLVDHAWVELFRKYDVRVGVSLDGPKEYHDQHRIDKMGRGTHDRVINAIQLLKSLDDSSLGTLTVIDPRFSPEKIYSYLAKVLGLKQFDFLLFDGNYDSPPPYSIASYGEFLVRLFNIWTKDDDPRIRIKYFAETLNLLTGKALHLYPIGPQKTGTIPMITIASDGSLHAVDEYAYLLPHLMKTNRTIHDISLKDFTKLPLFKFIDETEKTLPAKCNGCMWTRVCCGGSLQTRYSSTHNFDLPSIYCDCLNRFFTHVAAYLVANGYSEEKLYSRLAG